MRIIKNRAKDFLTGMLIGKHAGIHLGSERKSKWGERRAKLTRRGEAKRMSQGERGGG